MLFGFESDKLLECPVFKIIKCGLDVRFLNLHPFSFVCWFKSIKSCVIEKSDSLS